MAPAALRMAAGALLLLISFVPASEAQAPGLPQEQASQTLALHLSCPDTMLEPDYAGQDEKQCTVTDLSRDSAFVPGSNSGQGAQQHMVSVTWRPRPGYENVTGYTIIITNPQFGMYGGDVQTFGVNIKATPQVNAQDYLFDVLVNYRHEAAGYNRTMNQTFSAQVNPYDFAILSWAGDQAQKAGQDDVVIYSVSIQNTGVYPDIYRFTIVAKPDIRVTTPSNVYVGPGETRVVNISVLTPHGKVFEIGRSEAISIKVNSMGVGGISGTGVYSTTAVLQIYGPYIPVYWIPLTLVGLVSMGVVIRGARDKSERHRLEKGAPRRVDLTPRQEVLLAEMRRTDPATYKEKKKALDTVYVERRQDYRSHKKEREAADRAEAKQAAAEFAAQKKARKAARAEEKRQEKLARIEAKKEAKLLKKKEKALAKARKKVGKAQAKQAKKDAKLAAKQAKIDAKQAKKDAAAQAKADKEARKAEKAAAKALKKGQAAENKQK